MDSFRDDIGLIRQLDIDPVPIDLDIGSTEYRYRLWEWYGPRVGWAPKFSPQRRHRPLRLEHACVQMPARRDKRAKRRETGNE